MVLPGAQVRHGCLPDSSDCAHLLQRIFSVTAGEAGCCLPLLPGGHLTLFFPQKAGLCCAGR